MTTSACSAAYIMEDPREAMRLELKVDPVAWVQKYVARHLRPPAQVLSIGCGPGVILNEICALDPSIRAIGIDISGERVEEAIQRHRGKPQLQFKKGDAHQLPVPSDSFDLVYSRMLFEYLKDKQQAAAEMVRACRPGGKVMLQDLDGQLVWNFPEEASLQDAIQKVVGGLAKTGFDPFVGRKLYSFAHKAGLRNIDVKVECYHLIAGEIDGEILRQWELKLEIAVPQIARVLGDEGQARGQVQRFLDYFRRPDTLTYSNVFTVTGEKSL
jgi:ubiquinone/menaquinone biosynthesis C-methylase UbiE